MGFVSSRCPSMVLSVSTIHGTAFSRACLGLLLSAQRKKGGDVPEDLAMC